MVLTLAVCWRYWTGKLLRMFASAVARMPGRDDDQTRTVYATQTGHE